jgi:lipid-A-disaccharide synthase
VNSNNMKRKLRIGIVAGEVSGDTLGAGLIKALQQYCPDAQFEGIGGPKMIACGFRTLVPMERLSVMGFIEPLGRLPELLRIKKHLQNHFIESPPDVFIGIDSPGFNLRVERVLHDHGIRTVHYVSPSVWAWGEKRIHDIAQAVDLVLALFPFETEIYERHNIGVRFIGHPLADQIDPEADDANDKLTARLELGLPVDAQVLAMLPGSRRDEINRLGRLFIRTARQSLLKFPELHFVIPCANAERHLQLNQMLRQENIVDGLDKHFHIIDGHSHRAMKAADLVVLASGTATLEAMLLKRPMVVCYRLAPLTWMLAKRLVKVKHVGLPNLLADESLVPELLQNRATVPELTAAIERLLCDTEQRQYLLSRFADIHVQIRRDASIQAAAAVLELIAGEGTDHAAATLPS